MTDEANDTSALTGEAIDAGIDPSAAAAARRARVDRVRAQWIDRLIDPSRRNNLLFFRDLAPASGMLSRVWASVSNGAYRHALRLMRGACRTGSLPAAQALAGATAAASAQSAWAASAADARRPRAIDGLDEARRGFDEVLATLAVVYGVFPQRALADAVMADVGAWLDALSRDHVTPARLLRVQEIEGEIEVPGCVRSSGTFWANCITPAVRTAP